MRKRSKNRKLKIMICLLIFLIIIAILGIYFYYDFRNKKIYEEMNIQFIENKVIEYGDKDATSKKLVKNAKGTILKYPEIDVMKVGKQELLYQLEDNKITKEIQTEIEIKDTKRPEIILKKSKITLPYGADFNMASNIKQVKDVVDGNIPYNENKEKNSYWFEGNIDAEKAGTYPCKVIAVDKNGNKAEKSFEVIIEEKQIDEYPSKQSNNKQQEPNETNQPYFVNGILVVNKHHALPRDYGYGNDETAYSALLQLQQAAADNGFSIPLLSGYRSYDYQSDLYNQYVARDGVEAADRYSARPGYSEHQTGLAFDIGSIDNNYGYTPAGQWLAQNAHTYGFIIRYPEGKESITGYMYEPWHVRYLGKDVAQQVYARGLTLEEFLQIN